MNANPPGNLPDRARSRMGRRRRVARRICASPPTMARKFRAFSVMSCRSWAGSAAMGGACQRVVSRARRLSAVAVRVRLQERSRRPRRRKEPRVNLKEPAQRLALLKPTRGVPHKGGSEFAAGGWELILLAALDQRRERRARERRTPSLASLGRGAARDRR